MKHTRTAFVAVWLLFACGDDATQEPTPTIQGTPIALDHQLVFVDPPHARAYVLDVGAARPKAETRRIKLPPSAASFERRKGDHDEALILCAGQRGNVSEDAAPSALVSIASSGKTRNYELGTTPFNAFTQSDDGRYLVAYRNGPANGRTLDNPNELVVVDLDKQPEEDGAVTRKTPDGLAHTLTSVLISPTLEIAGEGRRLLVVLAAAEVTLFDLGHLERRATIVQLDETRTIDPEQVVFSEMNPTLYVRAKSSDNIFMFRFESHSNDELGNDFRPTVNPLGGGSGPSDMKLFGDENNERLMVVASGSSQVLVIDPSTSKTNALTLKTPAQHILLFEGPSPRDSSSHTHALLYNDTLSGISFFDPEGLSDEPEDQLEMLSTPSPVKSLISLKDDGKVVLLQQAGLSVLDLAAHTLTPISSDMTLATAAFDPMRKRLWAVPAGEYRIGTLDLTTGKTDEVRLDAPVSTLVPMFSEGRLCALHSADMGYVTLVDLNEPDREHAISVRGFFINNLLDRGDN